MNWPPCTSNWASLTRWTASPYNGNGPVCRIICCYTPWRHCLFEPPPRSAGPPGALFREPAILLQIGWVPVQIRQGDNRRHRHPESRQADSLSRHADTLRDELRRLGASAWQKAQRAGVKSLYRRGLVKGPVYAVDGSGLGPGLRLVCLVCVSGDRPLLAAWRLLTGDASGKRPRGGGHQELVEQVLAVGGPGSMQLLLADALYADGPLLAWLKYAQGIDALVALPSDRLLYQDVQGLSAWRPVSLTSSTSYVRTVQGHKQRRVVGSDLGGRPDELGQFHGGCQGDGNGRRGASLWCFLLITRDGLEPRLLWPAGTMGWCHDDALLLADGFAALLAYRPRWHVEDDSYRELKEGWGLEEQRWGRDEAATRGRVTLTCLAFNTAQVYRSQAGQRLARKGIRRLRREYQRELGAAPVVVYMSGCYAALAVEELLAALGRPVRESLLPFGGCRPMLPAPT